MKNLKNFTLSGIITLSIMVLAVMGYAATNEGKTAHRIMALLGGNVIGGGYIQAMTYLAFFLGFFEIRDKIRLVHRERRAFGMNIIPTNEKNVFLNTDISNLKFKLVEMAKKDRFMLVDLLKKACTKFRSADTLGELIDIVSIQVDIYENKSESDQSIIRYLVWVIPSLGFIGTVIGISSSLAIANSGDMDAITQALAVAFDTTLISLVLSAVIMWYLHELQEKSDRLHSDLREFVIENLVNKIERH
jgi:biopolymer transport protein ExbB/TolQ